MKLNLLVTKKLTILKQLELEEALLRTDNQNWCLINDGSAPSIVLGSSNQSQEMIDYEHSQIKNLSIIKRFSAGGTVVVDHNTIFVTFIFNSSAHKFNPFPEPILRWTNALYQKSLNIKGFDLKENDYAIFDKKVAGNAQYLKKDRWLHHSTFLYDYNKDLMESLKHPKFIPDYRKNRTHSDFLTTLKPYIPSKSYFIQEVEKNLSNLFSISNVSLSSLQKKSFPSYRKSTKVLASHLTL